MFQSATLKLTGWYLLILMVLSLIFSIAIYNIASHEINVRLEHLQVSLLDLPGRAPMMNNSFRNGESQEASSNLSVGLFYANLFILIVGGIGSYILAKRTLRPIKEVHEAQSRFTSDASHELRTPLAAMKTELEVVLRDKSATQDDMKEVLVSNLEEVEKLTYLSEMLLNLSRLEHDKLDNGPVDLYKLTKDILRHLNLPQDRIALSAHKHYTVEANPAAIRELILILIDNALKYSPDKSLVMIALSSSNRFVSFEITNTGDGIDPAKLPHIFDRFYRADSSRTSNHKKGYGLGLALAKKIVELHNGELTASSAPKQATTFTVQLPISKKN